MGHRQLRSMDDLEKLSAGGGRKPCGQGREGRLDVGMHQQRRRPSRRENSEVPRQGEQQLKQEVMISLALGPLLGTG